MQQIDTSFTMQQIVEFNVLKRKKISLLFVSNRIFLIFGFFNRAPGTRHFKIPSLRSRAYRSKL